MAKQSLQEKFQASFPYKGEDGEKWAMVPRKTYTIDHQEAAGLPPLGIKAKRLAQMPLTTAGQSDESKRLVNNNSLRDGFTYIGMSGTDDQYTGENMDHFYGEAVGNDDAGNRVTGFVERNNYLDRE